MSPRQNLSKRHGLLLRHQTWYYRLLAELYQSGYIGSSMAMGGPATNQLIVFLLMVLAHLPMLSFVNETTQKNDLILEQGKAANLILDGVQILCFYFKSTEKSIRSIHANKDKDFTKGHTPYSSDDADWGDLHRVTAVLTEQFLKATKALHGGNYADIRNPRAVYPEMSVATKVIEVTGIDSNSRAENVVRCKSSINSKNSALNCSEWIQTASKLVLRMNFKGRKPIL